MDTRLRNASSVPGSVGLADVANDDPRYEGRHETRLAKAVGITQFGVNYVTLNPGAFSANRHWHEAEDEFVYVLSGTPSLFDDNGRHRLKAGDIIGFPSGETNAQHIVNDSNGDATIHYPDDSFGPIRK